MSEQDYRVVYDPELDPKKKYKLQKSYKLDGASASDPRVFVKDYHKIGKKKAKLVQEYYPILFDYDEFSTIKSTNSILITTSSKVPDSELLMVIQGIGKLESFMFAKNYGGSLLMSVTFGHSSAVREALLKWNNTRVHGHHIMVELDEDCNLDATSNNIGQKFHDRKINPKDQKQKNKVRDEPPSPRRKEERITRVERYRPEISIAYKKKDIQTTKKITIKEKEKKRSTLEMIQEEIVEIVERDYHNRVILGMISDFLKNFQIPKPMIDESVSSRNSVSGVTVTGDSRVKRPLPTFKKLKTIGPVENASAKLIKKNYKLLSKKKRFYMESDADSSTSDSDASSSSEEEAEVLDEKVGVKEDDMMEVDTEQSEIDVKLEQDQNDANVVKSTKKRARVKKTSNPKKKVKRQTKEPVIYQKPVRVPFDFTQYEDALEIQNPTANAQVPDNDYQSDDSLDISNLDLKEMGYDSEDQRIIHSLLMEEVDRRRMIRAKRTELFDEDEQRRHLTGSARSEGYYAITSAQKKSHARAVSQKNRDVTVSPSKPLAPSNIPNEIRIATSRASRFTQRQLIPGHDTKKQLVPIDSAESVRFKQMKNRKRRLKFAKSDIHDWGLFAMEKIEANDMIIEYIGEKIRLKIADLREIEYEKQGIGSSYLFRVDDDIVIDATKIGNLARFINHCCEVRNFT